MWDTKLKGLGCRITPAGSQAFVLRYTDAKGRQRLATLARVSEIALKHVRELAAGELVKIRIGEADILSRRQERRSSLTVAQGITRFFEEFCPQARHHQPDDPPHRAGIQEAGAPLPHSRARQAGHRRSAAPAHRTHGGPPASGPAQPRAGAGKQNLQVLRGPGAAAPVQQSVPRRRAQPGRAQRPDTGAERNRRPGQGVVGIGNRPAQPRRHSIRHAHRIENQRGHRNALGVRQFRIRQCPVANHQNRAAHPPVEHGRPVRAGRRAHPGRLRVLHNRPAADQLLDRAPGVREGGYRRRLERCAPARTCGVPS